MGTDSLLVIELTPTLTQLSLATTEGVDLAAVAGHVKSVARAVPRMHC